MTRKIVIKYRSANRRVHRHRRVNNILAKRRAEVEESRFSADFDETQFSEETSIPINTQKPLSEMLRSWISIHRITTRAVNDLLQILKKSGNIKKTNKQNRKYDDTRPEGIFRLFQVFNYRLTIEHCRGLQSLCKLSLQQEAGIGIMGSRIIWRKYFRR